MSNIALVATGCRSLSTGSFARPDRQVDVETVTYDRSMIGGRLAGKIALVGVHAAYCGTAEEKSPPSAHNC